jgi:hypothetical protein
MSERTRFYTNKGSRSQLLAIAPETVFSPSKRYNIIEEEVYISEYLCIDAYMITYTYLYNCLYIHVSMYIRIYINIHKFICMNTCICMHICIYIPYIYIYIYMYLYISIYRIKILIETLETFKKVPKPGIGSFRKELILYGKIVKFGKPN